MGQDITKKHSNRLKKKKGKTSQFKEISKRLDEVYILNCRLDEKISLIKEKGVNHKTYQDSFRIIDQIKHSLNSFYNEKMSRGQFNKYNRRLGYFNSKFSYFKRLTYKFYVNETRKKTRDSK